MSFKRWNVFFTTVDPIQTFFSSQHQLAQLDHPYPIISNTISWFDLRSNYLLNERISPLCTNFPPNETVAQKLEKVHHSIYLQNNSMECFKNAFLWDIEAAWSERLIIKNTKMIRSWNIYDNNDMILLEDNIIEMSKNTAASMGDFFMLSQHCKYVYDQFAAANFFDAVDIVNAITNLY